MGFGKRSGNYWLGNDLLSQLTANNRYKLKFDLQLSKQSSWYNAEYSTFRVQSESDNYRLEVAGYSGNAGHDAVVYHNDATFSTYDRDNDRSSKNCAADYAGGFWYRDCFQCGVNNARSTLSFFWAGLHGDGWLRSSRMWLQCK